MIMQRAMVPDVSPWRELDELPQRFARIFGASAAFIPAVDIAESDNELKIVIELAGMRKNDVDIERRYGSFERAFTLPRGVDTSGIKAEFHDGLLTIRVPHATPIKGKKVEITTTP